jgi:hypothetical protein
MVLFSESKWKKSINKATPTINYFDKISNTIDKILPMVKQQRGLFDGDKR